MGEKKQELRFGHVTFERASGQLGSGRIRRRHVTLGATGRQTTLTPAGPGETAQSVSRGEKAQRSQA